MNPLSDDKLDALLDDALATELDGRLPGDFADTVARRAMPSRAPFPWFEAVVLPVVLTTVFAGLLWWFPIDFSPILPSFQPLLHTLSDVQAKARVDVLVGAGVVLVLIALLDAGIQRIRGRHVRPLRT